MTMEFLLNSVRNKRKTEKLFCTKLREETSNILDQFNAFFISVFTTEVCCNHVANIITMKN